MTVKVIAVAILLAWTAQAAAPVKAHLLGGRACFSIPAGFHEKQFQPRWLTENPGIFLDGWQGGDGAQTMAVQVIHLVPIIAKGSDGQPLWLEPTPENLKTSIEADGKKTKACSLRGYPALCIEDDQCVEDWIFWDKAILRMLLEDPTQKPTALKTQLGLQEEPKPLQPQ